MATLDLKTANDEPVSLYAQVDGKDYLLANLNKKEHSNIHLDLIFSEGEKIKFYTAGNGNVHLTGYAMPDDDMPELESDFDDEDLESDSELINPLNAKRKNTETLKLQGKDSKKLKTNEGKAVEANAVAKQNSKIVDVDPKQLMQNNKKDQKKPAAANQAQSQQKAKQPQAAKKNESVDSEDDDDLSIDEDDSVDLNQLMDDSDDSQGLDDEELDLESSDDEDGKDDSL